MHMSLQEAGIEERGLILRLYCEPAADISRFHLFSHNLLREEHLYSFGSQGSRGLYTWLKVAWAGRAGVVI